MGLWRWEGRVRWDGIGAMEGGGGSAGRNVCVCVGGGEVKARGTYSVICGGEGEFVEVVGKGRVWYVGTGSVALWARCFHVPPGNRIPVSSDVASVSCF